MATKTPAKKNADIEKAEQATHSDNGAPAGAETVEFDVTLANGKTITLEALKNEDDWDLELLDHAQRGNYAVFIFGVLTWKSRFLLKQSGAKVPDFETISIAYGEAVGAVEDD